jgi:serine/threonine protein phosphatase 1
MKPSPRDLRSSAESSSLQDTAGRRIYAVGDIHGCIEELRALHGLIQADAAAHPRRNALIVYLGDYIDRGMDSRAVVNLLLHEPLPGFESIHLKGNHEDILIRFLDDERIAPLWLANGGAATLLSYGVHPPTAASDRTELRRVQRELSDTLPPEHVAFLRQLRISYDAGDYFFVHAGVRPHVPIAQQTEEDMIWIRYEFLGSDSHFGKIVVHGHNITLAPEVRPNRIGIDTGAFASGRLTCLVIDGSSRSFICT